MDELSEQNGLSLYSRVGEYAPRWMRDEWALQSARERTGHEGARNREAAQIIRGQRCALERGGIVGNPAGEKLRCVIRYASPGEWACGGLSSCNARRLFPLAWISAADQPRGSAEEGRRLTVSGAMARDRLATRSLTSCTLRSRPRPGPLSLLARRGAPLGCLALLCVFWRMAVLGPRELGPFGVALCGGDEPRKE